MTDLIRIMDGPTHGLSRTDEWTEPLTYGRTDPWTDAWTDTGPVPLWTLEVEQHQAHTVTDHPSRRPDLVHSGKVVS